MLEVYPLKLTWSGSTSTRAFSRTAEATAPGKAPIPLSAGDPNIGDVTLWNPEDLLGASLSMCHMLTFLALAAKVGIDVRHYDGAAEAVLDTVDKVTRITTIRLVPTITVGPGTDVDRARQFFEKAHHYCYIANSIRSEVVMEPVFVVAET